MALRTIIDTHHHVGTVINNFRNQITTIEAPRRLLQSTQIGGPQKCQYIQMQLPGKGN
jgi:hypothetical protein